MAAPCKCGCQPFAEKAPPSPRVAVFIDGQNLFRQAHRCFGNIDVPYLNYDPIRLSAGLIAELGRKLKLKPVLQCVHFYSGRPWGDAGEDDLGQCLIEKTQFYSRNFKGQFFYDLRRLTYRPKRGQRGRGHEKGVDVALAVSAVLGAVRNDYDVAIIASQDTDQNATVEAIQKCRADSGRWLHIESAYPVTDKLTVLNQYDPISPIGLAGCQWLHIPRDLYNSARDAHDFRTRYLSGQPVLFSGPFELASHDGDSTCAPGRNWGGRTQCEEGQSFPVCSTCRGKVLWVRYFRSPT